MNRFFTDQLSTGGIQKALVLKMMQIPLTNVPFHDNTESITRYFAENFPLHVAVHEVSPVSKAPEQYTHLHFHEDCDEVNIIISQDYLLYKIQLGEKEYYVKNNSSIWIPRGIHHSANVVEGSGYFITIRM